jgi:hypothetical protein
MEKSTALCTNCHLEAHGGNPWDKGSENMRKALIILALLAVTSCASMTETKVDDCAESMAYAALVCSSDSLFGAGDCAEGMSFVAIDCGYAAVTEGEAKPDEKTAKEPSEKQKKKPGEGTERTETGRSYFMVLWKMKETFVWLNDEKDGSRKKRKFPPNSY